MQMPKAIATVAHCFAAEHGFSQLSPEARRTAWNLAGLTHALVLPIAVGFAHVAPGLDLTLRDIVISHFMIALLLAKLVEVMSAICELFKLPPLRLVSSGWFFAFAVTLQPLFLLSFALWAIG